MDNKTSKTDAEKELLEQDRTVITEAVRSILLTVNGETGAEKLDPSKGLRDCYIRTEELLGTKPGELDEKRKNIVRFEFDKLLDEYTSSGPDWKLVSVKERYGAKDGDPFKKRNATWRNTNVPMVAYPQVVMQLKHDLTHLNKSLELAISEGNSESIAKIKGKIRQKQNNIFIVSGAYDKWAAEHASKGETVAT